jgi:hypothetical protein
MKLAISSHWDTSEVKTIWMTISKLANVGIRFWMHHAKSVIQNSVLGTVYAANFILNA